MAFGEESFTQAKISPCFHKVRVLVLIVETLALVHTDNPYCHNTHPIPVLVLRMAQRKWKDTKQQPCTAVPGNMLGCCLIIFRFLWAILSTSTVVHHTDVL